MKQLVEEGPDVICSARDWKKGSCGDLCGIEECARRKVGDVARRLHFAGGWTVEMGVWLLAGIREDEIPSMVAVLWFWPLWLWLCDSSWAKVLQVATQ